MGYGQWVGVTIKNHTGYTLSTRELYLSWGKLYAYLNMDVEADFSLTVRDIANGEEFTFACCGKEDSPSGTEGSINLYGGLGGAFTFKWRCHTTRMGLCSELNGVEGHNPLDVN